MRGIIAVSFFVCLANAEISQPSDPFYIGGVVEFSVLKPGYEPEDTRDRITEFRRLIDASPIIPDILVFPENVLNNRSYPVIVPAPQRGIVPCSSTEHDYIFTEISCYARSFQTYILINVIEVENCSIASDVGVAALKSMCPVYNTNVVFDRQGAIISRYRKYNLIGAEWEYYNYTSQPEQEATFDTDFNVTFGHFTRMDLLYYRPAQALVAQGISDFLHPSKWKSELPFMTAMQLHQSWAYANGVNLLVSGTNDPRNGLTGTGIYAGEYGTLIASMTTDETKRKLYLSVLLKRGYDLNALLPPSPSPSQSSQPPAIVNQMHLQNLQPSNWPMTQSPQSQQQQEQQQQQKTSSVSQFTDRITGINLSRDSDVDFYTTQPLPPMANNATDDEIHEQICHNDLCCNFHIKRRPIENTTATNDDDDDDGGNVVSYQYRLAAYKGMGTFLQTEPESVATCTLLACISDHVYSCARIFPETSLVENRFVFDFIEIGGNFTHGTRPNLIVPSSVDGMLLPLPMEEFNWSTQETGAVIYANHTLLQPKADLLTFGIYANYFLDETIYDNHHKDSAMANGQIVHGIVFVLLLILLVLQ